MTDADDIAAEFLECLRGRFHGRWDINCRDTTLTMHSCRPMTTSPRRVAPRPRHIVDTIAASMAGQGIPRPSLLPVRWGRDTDLLISAIQGLDPWLKDGADQIWREGFLPQPVVRFTGDRDERGRLKDGFLTSFVNMSCVMRVDGPARHVELIDLWIAALSAVGLHAGRLELHGNLTPWRRREVCGITVHIDGDGIGFADAVLLWHAEDSGRMATDIGSGLERLVWLLGARPWPEVAFGALAGRFDIELLDAVRAATLLAMGGVQATNHGAGAALRRVARRVPDTLAASGLGRLVAAQRAYWADIGMVGPDWAQLATSIEAEVLRQASSRSP